MENNILKVVFGADRTNIENYARSTPLWQYDYGQKLLIEGVTLPMAYEVHFSNKRHGNSVTVIGDDTGVDIPDEMLLSGQDVYAWVYLHSTENDGETEYMVTIPVNKRAEPTNDLPTPVQQDVIDQTIAALQDAVAKSETNVEHYPCIIDGYWYVWDAEQNAFVNTEVSGHGEKGDDGKDGNGIAKIELNQDYTLTFYYTNGTSYTTGSIRGAQGPQGEPGPKGDKGDKGDPGKPMDIIDDTAGAGETERAWSADKLVTELGTKADKTDTVLNTTLSRGRKANSTTGAGSSAFGNEVEASGAYSHAEGEWTIAHGTASHAEGAGSQATSDRDHAEGSGTRASGGSSHAEGGGTVASGSYSHAEGGGSQSTGESSHAEGNYTKATSNYAHSEGNNTTASGSSSHAEGYKATASNSYAHAEGDNTTASGQASHAEGVRTEATGLGSHAEGYYSKSTGQYAHTEGARGDIASKMYNGVLYVVGASGARSHAEGLGGIAAGTEAHAEGNGTYAIGDDSHAEGIETKAIGSSAHAEGSYNIASGMCSHVEGYSTIANGHNSHVSGRYNIADGNNNYAEIIGNGTGNATRSNARSLDWNGNEYLRGDLYVNCNPDGTGGTKLPKDVQIDGTSILNNGVANIPPAINGELGLAKYQGNDYGVMTLSSGLAYLVAATSTQIKNANSSYKPIVPSKQHESIFYGLAKAAGDTTQSSSSNAVGVYTDDAKLKIQQMLGLWTPKIYMKYTLDEDAQSVNSDNFPFNDTKLNIYDELVLCIYQSDTTQTAYGSNDYGYFTIRDAVNSGYINVGNMYLKTTKQCSIMRVKRLPYAVVVELINDGSTYMKAFPRSLDYVDKIRWISASVSNGTFKAGTTIETYISRFI